MSPKRQAYFRSSRTLGVTAREGPRTGHLYVPWELSENIADKFISHFDDFCTDNRVKPPALTEDIVGGTALLPDAATGQPIPIVVAMTPSVEAFHETSLPATGAFDPSTNTVYISPTKGACKSRESWRNILLSVIRHELSHASDPGLYLENKKLMGWMTAFQKWMKTGADPTRVPTELEKLPKKLRPKAKAMVEKALFGREPIQKTFCEYIQTPPEQNAFLTQVATELRLVGKRLRATGGKGFKDPKKALNEASPTFREIEKCLTPSQRKRFLKTAARLWEEGDLPHALAGDEASRRKRQQGRGTRR